MKRLVALACSILSSSAILTGVAHAQSNPGRVSVVEVTGYIDPPTADFLSDSVLKSQNQHDEALVIQLNSSRVFISQSKYDALLEQIRDASVPVVVWVGSFRAVATGPVFMLTQAADYVTIAPSSKIGPAGHEVGANQAVRRHFADKQVAFLQQLMVVLNGKTLDGHKLSTTKESVTKPGDVSRKVSLNIAFSKPSLMARLLHTAASPSMAYILLILGLLLLLFEFYTVGIGIAAAVGALFLVPASYGLWILPTRPWALLLILLGFVGFAIDVQAGAARAWTLIGSAAYVVGSVFLYSVISLSIVTFIPMMFVTFAVIVAGLPSTIRSRFSTASIGRDWMIGSMGTAAVDVNPDGTVDLRGGLWPARTNRATPITKGDAIRVVGIDGIVLEVEPEHGGAKEAHH